MINNFYEFSAEEQFSYLPACILCNIVIDGFPKKLSFDKLNKRWNQNQNS